MASPMTPINDDRLSFANTGNGGRPAVGVASGGGMLDVAMTRAAQEVQAAMVVAKRFPRNEDQALQKILAACGRAGLAEAAIYEYPRGKDDEGKKNYVTGPSIRLAEAIAQCWGNLSFGIIELEQRFGESTVMAYAWDLESNTRQDKVFTVKHERHTRSRDYKLTDPRDIYELTANQGARRLRACILGVIPGDVVEAAVDRCEETEAKKNRDKPLKERRDAMVAKFKELGVTTQMLVQFLSHDLDTVTERELTRLRKVFTTIRDNIASREEFFPPPAPPPGSAPTNTAPGAAGLAGRLQAERDARERTDQTLPDTQLPEAEARQRVREADTTRNPAPNEPAKQNDAVDPLDELVDQGADAIERALWSKARDRSPKLSRKDFDGGLFKFIERHGGRVDGVARENWKALYRAIVDGSFDFKTGVIVET